MKQIEITKGKTTATKEGEEYESISTKNRYQKF